MAYALFRRQASPLWYIEWMANGERREECLGTPDEHEAERRAAVHLTPAAYPHPHADETAHAPAYAVGHALEDFIARGCIDNAPETLRCYRQRAGHLLRRLGELPVSDLQLDTVQEYINARLVEGAARETVRKELCVFRRTLDLANRRGHRTLPLDEILPRFKTRYVPRKVWLAVEEFEALLCKLNARHKLWVLVAVYTGARFSEVERLDWQDVDFRTGRLRIRGTKGKAEADRFVGLHPRLAEALAARRRVRGPVVQPWRNVRRDLPRACVRAGVKRVVPNDLRRTFASWLVQRGETSYVVSQLLGHTSSVMVERVYGRLSDATLQSAINKLP